MIFTRNYFCQIDQNLPNSRNLIPAKINSFQVNKAIEAGSVN